MKSSHLNIVVVGRGGQVARELESCLPSLGRVTVVGRPEVDLLRPESVRQAIRQAMPDVVVNTAAYTAVDQAETEREIAMAVNAEAPRVLAEEARRINALLVTYSTDYVFDGTKAFPYTETDVPGPLNVYGVSKLAGDLAVAAVGGSYVILRTSWLYGPHGKNFLRTIVRLAVERKELRVVDDQVGAPTWSRDLALATSEVIRRLTGETSSRETLNQHRGVYNINSQGSVSWFGFAQAILEGLYRRGMKKEQLANVVPIATQDYAAAAMRPRNSRLSNEKIRQAFGVVLPEWSVSLTKVMTEMDIPQGTLSSARPGR